MTKINPNAIDLAAGFEVGSVQPIDSRLNMTVAQMAAVSDDVMPDTYLTVCKDDGAIYLYNKTNTVDPTTGKFRKLEGVEADFLEVVETMPAITSTTPANKIYAYCGADTEDYKRGNIYKIGNISEEVSVYAIDGLSDVAVTKDTSWEVGDTAYYNDGTDWIKSTLGYDDTESKWFVVGKEDEKFIADDVRSEFTISYEGQDWVPAINIDDLLEGYVKHFAVLPTASVDYVNQIVQYIGETTVVEPIRVKGHFYECKLVPESDPAQYTWEPVDTELDVYDNIENRPLILTRGEELFNDTVTLDAGDTTTTTITDKVLVADKEYIISVDGVEHSYTATLDTADDSIKLDASDIGIVVTTADGATDSTMVLTNSEFASDPAIIVKEANIVEVNPDYADFFDSVTDGASMQEDVVANVEVGGVAVGDTVAQGKTLTEVMKQILVKYFAPTISITTTKSLIQKKGTTLTQPIDIKVVSTKKSDNITKTWIEDAEGNELDAGTTPTGETLNYEWTTDITTDTTFYGKATDGKTPVSSSIKFEFIDPFYWGESATNVLDQVAIEALTMDLSKKGAKKYTYPATVSASYLVIAYPSSYGVLTKIEDQNKFDNTPDWSRSEVVFNEGTAEEVSYYVYVTSGKKTLPNPFFYTFTF